MPPRGKIPDRWLPYKACGDVIEGTRFICFKVPLHKKVLKERGIKTIWDVPAVIAEIPKLGAVIDLTNTARYYDPREFEEANINHRKILMPGREIPPDEKVQEFMDAVDQFLGKDCDSLIGVHCTHGLNRTGFMVCRYMRDRLNMPAEDAIKRFEKARGYEIEREIYRADLLGTTYVPPPDFGKATVIKPIYEENGVQPPNQGNTYDIDNQYQHDNSYYPHEGGSQSQPYYNNYHPYDNGNRYQRYDNNRYRYTKNGSNNRYNERNSTTYSNDGNTRNSDDSYLSWRRRDDNSSSNGYSPRKYKIDNRNRSESSKGPEYNYKHDY